MIKIVRVFARPLLLTLCAAANGLAQESATAQPSRSAWDGVYTAAQAGRGRDVYGRECVNCHGSNLRGGEIAPALVGIPFELRWRGKTLRAYYDAMVSTMPQDNPASLPPPLYADLVAYILMENRFPAGEHELDAADEALEKIVIAKRPSPDEP